jgi:hypothetical protein
MLKRRTSGWILVLSLLLAGPVAAQQAQDRGDELRAAASAGDLAKLKELLDAGVDPNLANAYGGTALAFAADRGRTEAVKLLLERGANPNTKDKFYGGFTPLGAALQKEHMDIARLLIEKGAEGEDQALVAAAAQGNMELAKLIVDRKKVTPDQLKEAMTTANAEGKTEIVQLLLAAGVPPPVTVDAATLKSYEGEYEGPNSMAIKVALEDGKLKASGPGMPVLNLGPVDNTTFQPAGFAGIKLIFNVENGKTVGMTVEQGGQPMVLKKKETQNP